MKHFKNCAMTLIAACLFTLSTANIHANGFQLFEFGNLAKTIRAWCTTGKNHANKYFSALHKNIVLLRKNFLGHLLYGSLLFEDNSKIPPQPNKDNVLPSLGYASLWKAFPGKENARWMPFYRKLASTSKTRDYVEI